MKEKAMEFPVTIDSQDSFDNLVKDRIARVKAQYADYDDLKARADKFDTDKADLDNALAAAITRAETAEGKVTAFETEKQVDTWRTEVATATGVPAAALRGSTKEEFTAHAETLKPLITAPRGPVIPNQGDQPEKPASNSSWSGVLQSLGESRE